MRAHRYRLKTCAAIAPQELLCGAGGTAEAADAAPPAPAGSKRAHHMPRCSLLAFSIPAAPQGFTAMDIACSTRNVPLLRRLEQCAPYVGWLLVKVRGDAAVCQSWRVTVPRCVACPPESRTTGCGFAARSERCPSSLSGVLLTLTLVRDSIQQRPLLSCGACTAAAVPARRMRGSLSIPCPLCLQSQEHPGPRPVCPAHPAGAAFWRAGLLLAAPLGRCIAPLPQPQSAARAPAHPLRVPGIQDAGQHRALLPRLARRGARGEPLGGRRLPDDPA